MARFNATTARPEAQAPWATLYACTLIVFLVLFPKGGVRLGPLPLTWGYLLLAAITPLAIAVRFLLMPLVFPKRTLAALLMLIPFQMLFIYAGEYNGVMNVSFTFSTFVGLFALPWIFLLCFAPFFPLLDEARFTRVFCRCVFYAAAWGVFLFVLHPITGHFIEVPYLTVNASDYGELENTKNIARGSFFKLISTYNNGNLYGVSTLLVFPLFLRLEKSRLRKLTVRAALLLTLSRTVWAGLIVSELLSLVPHLVRQVETFPVVYLRAIRRRLIAIGVTLALVVATVIFTLSSSALAQFLLDRSLGNRAGQISAAETDVSFMPPSALYGFGEVLYASAAEYWGISGLLSFTLIMFSPLLLLWAEPRLLRQPLRRAALKGLVIYIVLAASDGALDFIPVMAFYWFTYTVFLVGWPGIHAWQVGARLPEPLPDPTEGNLREAAAGA